MTFYILADCNNFYASCERVFNPKLEGKPIIILSNNDGCVVARSNESKKLGIKMGVPFFTIKDLALQHAVHVFSSNYSLYGDLSRRVMDLLSERSFEIEVYSIDEAFLRYPQMEEKERVDLAISLKKSIKQCVGIPISCGIGPTKTLAKLSSEFAKKQTMGVYDLYEKKKIIEALKITPIEEIWGIGSRLSKRLKAKWIHTAYDFYNSSRESIRNLMGVNGEKIYLELHGIPCHDIEEPQSKKSIGVSRSFGQGITTLSSLKEALATHIITGSLKLRQQNSLALCMHVYLEFKIDGPTFRRGYTSLHTVFQSPTNHTPLMLEKGHQLLEKLFDQTIIYRKCGIFLTDLCSENQGQADLFLKQESSNLMATFDAIEKKYGKSSITFASTLIKDTDWRVKCDKKSTYSTTDPSLFPVVLAK